MDTVKKYLLCGSQVLLRVPEEGDEILLSEWSRDSEYMRLLMAEPARFLYASEQKKWLEHFEKKNAFFMIVYQADQKTIGEIHLSGIDSAAGNAWMSIAIGERVYRNKKLGSQAIELFLEHVFKTLDLNRLSLTVFAYNERALHVYRKAGFKIEGAEREAIFRDGRRWDIVYLGILKSEWLNNR